jgi:uncharacterized protein (TIGR03000 family)
MRLPLTACRTALAGLLVLGMIGLAAAQAPPPAQEPLPAYLRVYVPDPKAKLEIEGTATKSEGEVRTFVSPALQPLPAGKKYIYLIKATWTAAGQPVTVEKKVEVTPGQQIDVDFRKDAAAKKDEPKKDEPKKKDEAKKDEPKKDEPKKDEKKKDEPKKDEPKKDDKPKLDVPFVPTPEKVVDEMLKLAGVKEGDVVIDLGCGDGRIVTTAVKKFKAKSGTGIDLDPERIKDSNERARKDGVEGKVTFKQGDVLKLTEKDLEGVTVVTLYLFPEVNLKLRPILQKGLKPGARIVSHDFDMDDWKPEKEIKVDDDGFEHTVYLWTIKDPGKDPKKDEKKDEKKKG